MQPVCQLEEFVLTRLNIEALDCAPETNTGNARISFDYDLAVAADDDHRIRMEMTFSMQSADDQEQASCPYVIEAGIMGFFAFPQDMADEKIAYFCRVNTLSILYGILRGQIATVTGSFPHGKFVLPTVMMQDVVNEIEKRKQAAEADPGE